MLKNYLKTAWRNIFKQKIYSLINISGLALGLAFFILAALYADFNFSFDKFHENSDRIYCIERISTSDRHGLFSPAPLLPALLEEVPYVEDGVRYTSGGRRIVRYKDKQFYESNIRYVDKQFFKFFSFNLITGDPETVLSAPNSVVITREIAEKYFADEDPIGKDFKFDNQLAATVTGVAENYPKNSSIKFTLTFR
ncbi:ABC transporter permease [candidate division KSB1 bacterium]